MTNQETEKITKQRAELHQIIDEITNPKLMNYILHLIKSFLELRS